MDEDSAEASGTAVEVTPEDAASFKTFGRRMNTQCPQNTLKLGLDSPGWNKLQGVPDRSSYCAGVGYLPPMAACVPNSQFYCQGVTELW